MKITFLGTSHGIAEPDRFCSSALIEVGGNLYMIDAGAPISTLIGKYGYHARQLKHIFITHNHTDHYVGLVEFLLQMNDYNQFSDVNVLTHVPSLDVYDKMKDYVFSICPDKKRVNFVKYESGVIFDDGVIVITAVPNNHGAWAHIGQSYSFLIEAEGKKFMFTGDLQGGIPDYPTCITSGEHNLEFVVMEGAHTKLDKPEILEILSKTKTKTMYLNHYYDGVNPPEVRENTKKQLAKYFNFVVLKDGDVIEL